MEKGYIQVYTGNGKGKTTAAFGLALRALCSGMKVFVGQFVKSMKYNETAIAEHFSGIEIRQLGRGCFLDHDPEQCDKDMAAEGLRLCAEAMASGKYDLVILDEVTIAVHFGLISSEDVIKAMSGRAQGVEVVITGRYATDDIIAAADLVTEMKEIRHYYTSGVLSRDGIDH